MLIILQNKFSKGGSSLHIQRYPCIFPGFCSDGAWCGCPHLGMCCVHTHPALLALFFLLLSWQNFNHSPGHGEFFVCQFLKNIFSTQSILEKKINFSLLSELVSFFYWNLEFLGFIHWSNFILPTLLACVPYVYVCMCVLKYKSLVF